MLKEIENQPDENQNSSGGEDAMALILQQAGKSSDEVAALSTLDDADQTAENQFSGEAPTIASLFGTGKAHEFEAGTFAPSKKVAEVMGASLEFLLTMSPTKFRSTAHLCLFWKRSLCNIQSCTRNP